MLYIYDKTKVGECEGSGEFHSNDNGLTEDQYDYCRIGQVDIVLDVGSFENMSEADLQQWATSLQNEAKGLEKEVNKASLGFHASVRAIQEEQGHRLTYQQRDELLASIEGIKNLHAEKLRQAKAVADLCAERFSADDN